MIKAMVSSHRDNQPGENAASGNQLGFELGAVGAAANAVQDCKILLVHDDVHGLSVAAVRQRVKVHSLTS